MLRCYLQELFLFVVVCSVCHLNIHAHHLPCVPIRDCPYIYNLTKTQQNNSEQVFQLLKNAHCGFDASENPKVLCKQTLQQQCFTSDGNEGIVPSKRCIYDDCKIIVCAGVCIAESACHIKYTDWTVLNHLETNKCGNNDTYVCCPLNKSGTKTSSLPLPGECGYQPLSRKIFGGKETDLDEFAWMGLLQYRTGNLLKQACSASLINQAFLVTAAHCADPVAVAAMGYTDLDSVVLGEYNTATEIDCIEYDEEYRDCADKPKVIPIKSAVLHPQWKYPGTENDIALLKLLTPVNYTNFIKPICLPLEGWSPVADERLIISGWGKSPTETRTAVKMKAVITYTPCLHSTKSSTQICAGGKGTDICTGDSGGPLMLPRFVGRNFVMFFGGIASFGIGRCGTAPSVYTLVPKYLEWIKSEIVK